MSSRKRRGRGEGSIYERDDGLWVSSVSLGYTADGKRRRRTVYGKSKQEVQEKLRKLQSDEQAGMITATSKTTVADFVDQWVADAEKNHAPATIDRYKLTAEKVRAHLSRIPISALREQHVRQLFLDMGKSGESKDAQLKAGRLLSVACKRAVKERLLPANPVSELPRPERREVLTFNVKQLRELLEATAAHRVFRAYVPVAIDSGCRLRELLALEWRDVDFAAGTVTIIRTLSEVRGKLIIKVPKTKAGRRRIKLAPSTVQALREHQRLLREKMYAGPLVFPSEAGTYMLGANVLKTFKNMLAKCGLPETSLHSLRHASASMLITAGASAKVVQERLGHSKVDTTLGIYTHLFQSAQDAAADIFEQRLHGNMPEGGSTEKLA